LSSHLQPVDAGAPRAAGPKRNAGDRGAAALLFAAAFALFATTGARDITWLHSGEDGPEFAATALTLGIPHPTGYPLYTLIGRLVTLVPRIRPGHGLALLSALFAASTVVLLYLAIRRGASLAKVSLDGPAGTLGPAAASIAFALSPTFWSQSIITEVYALHLFFASLLVYLAIRQAGRATARGACLLIYFCGLALGHHLAIVEILPGVLFLLLERKRPGELLRALPFFLLGASVLLFLPIRGSCQPRFQWGVHETWEGFRWAALGSQYHFRLQSFSIERFGNLLGAFVGHRIPHEFGAAGWIVPTAGAFLVAVRHPVLFLGTFLPFLLNLGLTFAYEIPDPEAYYLPSYLLMALWSGIALAALPDAAMRLIARARRAAAPAPRAASRAVPVALGLALLLLAVAPLPGRARRLDASRDRTARAYADSAMAVLTPAAIVITQGDGRTFALWDACAEAGRNDISVAYQALFVWPWYLTSLHHTFPDRAFPWGSFRSDDMTATVINTNIKRSPLFLSFTDKIRANAYALEPKGPLFEITDFRERKPRPSADSTCLPIDITPYANADYRHDPFRPDPGFGPPLFPGLEKQTIVRNGIPLEIPADASVTGLPSVITSAYQPAFNRRIPLEPSPTRGIAFALDGGAIGKASIPVARLVLEYADGSQTEESLISNVDVWEYWEKNHGMTIPDDLLLWQANEGNESLVFHYMPCDPGRPPASVTIEGTGKRGDDGEYAGVAVFAITQVLARSPRPAGRVAPARGVPARVEHEH